MEGKGGGRGAVGATKGRNKRLKTKGWEAEDEETIEKLLVLVRREMDAEVDERMSVFDERADAMCRAILARYQLEQQRGTWAQRAGRWLSGLGAALWNSRAVRLLVP